MSDEQAERVGQEVAIDVESVESEVIKPAEQITLTKSEEAIVNKLRESDAYSFTGTKTDLGTAINYPRTSVRDALKRLEQKGVVQITPNEDGTFEYRLIALL